MLSCVGYGFFCPLCNRSPLRLACAYGGKSAAQLAECQLTCSICIMAKPFWVWYGVPPEGFPCQTQLQHLQLGLPVVVLGVVKPHGQRLQRQPGAVAPSSLQRCARLWRQGLLLLLLRRPLQLRRVPAHM